MKKITFIIGKLSKGGAERVVSILANKLSDTNEISIVVLSKNEKDYCINSNVNVISIPDLLKHRNGILKIFEKIKVLRSVLKNNKSDVIISFLSDVNIYSIISSFGLKVKIIVSERNYPKLDKYVPITRYIFNVNKILYRYSDRIVFQTEEIMKCFPKRIQKKGTIIGNPLSENLPITQKKIKKKEIVTISRLTEQKNIPLLIDAFEEVSKKYEDYKLLIYGEGSLQKQLEEKYRKLILENKIEFCGFQNDVHNRVKDSEIFVLSSDIEGMPNALMEAMAISIPCIATDSLGGGVRELSLNGELCILSPIKDKIELVNNIIYAIENSKEVKEMSKKASKYIRSKYDTNNIIRQWEELISETLL